MFVTCHYTNSVCLITVTHQFSLSHQKISHDYVHYCRGSSRKLTHPHLQSVSKSVISHATVDHKIELMILSHYNYLQFTCRFPLEPHQEAMCVCLTSVSSMNIRGSKWHLWNSVQTEWQTLEINTATFSQQAQSV
jgi:hypothetical protein